MGMWTLYSTNQVPFNVSVALLCWDGSGLAQLNTYDNYIHCTSNGLCTYEGHVVLTVL